MGNEGFEDINRFFGCNCAIRTSQRQRFLYYRNEAPLETVPSPERTKVSQVPLQFFSSPPPPEPPRSFQVSRLFPARKQNPPKRMGDRRGLPPLGPYRTQYPPQEQHGPEPAIVTNFKVAQLFGGIIRVDYGRFYQVKSLCPEN